LILRDGSRLGEGPGDAVVLVFGGSSAQRSGPFDQVRVRGDVEQFRLDERDQSVEVLVDERVQRGR